MSMFDCRLPVDVAVLDFRKAFDTMLDKLNHYGIDDDIHRQISDLTNHRNQYVVIDD